MSVSYIPLKTKQILWGKAAGRCQYQGCNHKLFRDPTTKTEFNQSYIAHIVADKPTGPRGDKVLSKMLKSELSNLMLLCDRHHRLVDKEELAKHTVDVLREMKGKHEAIIERITDFVGSNETHVILYGANIGDHSSLLNIKDVFDALEPDYYPSNHVGYQLGLGNSGLRDEDTDYWDFESKNLNLKFQQNVLALKESNPIQRYSVFAIAPQPLLIKLGTLFHDIANVEVYNPQKEPRTWKWNSGNGTPDYFEIIPPDAIRSKVALVFSLSANISQERVKKVLGDDCSIWEVTIEIPNNDFMKYRNQLSQFRNICRKVLNDIKSAHGESARINVFPAMLPSTAVEFGRVWYPKADLGLTIYDQNKKNDGFAKAIEID